jgi:hypothetical protein
MVGAGAIATKAQKVSTCANGLLAPKGQKKVARGREPQARYSWLNAIKCSHPGRGDTAVDSGALTRARSINTSIRGLCVASLRLPLLPSSAPFGAGSIRTGRKLFALFLATNNQPLISSSSAASRVVVLRSEAEGVPCRSRAG